MDLIVPFRAASADPATVAAASQSVRVEDVLIGMREPGEVRALFLRYLLMVVLVFLVARILAAWVRRRWKRLPKGAYHVVGGRVENDVIVPGEPKRRPCPELSKSVAKADLSEAGVVLRVPWWPLLAGRPLQIVATASGSGRIVASGQVDGDRTRFDGDRTRFRIRFGRDARSIGQSLNGGWAVVERDGNHYQLALWDHPESGEQVAGAVNRIWRELERRRPDDSEPETSTGTSRVGSSRSADRRGEAQVDESDEPESPDPRPGQRRPSRPQGDPDASSAAEPAGDVPRGQPEEPAERASPDRSPPRRLPPRRRPPSSPE